MYPTLKGAPANSEVKTQLLDRYDANCKKAARAIINANILVLHIGAGFSADSGLAVYNDITNVPAYNKLDLTYSDICDISWINKKPELFFGFWGKCFNDYRSIKPHEGYNIIKKWKETYFLPNDNLDETHFPNKFANIANLFDFGVNKPTNHPFFIYSSNVDAHTHTVGFNSNEIHEIHGTIEEWQCSSVLCTQDENKSKNKVWKAPKDFKFIINEETMLAEDIIFDTSKESDDKVERMFSSNFPKCCYCNSYARPCILMFYDNGTLIYTKTSDNTVYKNWQTIVNSTKENEDTKIVILEIGCGTRVPSVRHESRSILRDSPIGSTTLIRVNPEFPLDQHLRDEYSDYFIPIMSSGFKAIKKIDEYIENNNFDD